MEVKFIEHDGTEHVVDTEVDWSVMEAGVKNGVPGIDADCGGSAACATCHVMIDPSWADRAGPATEIEEGMLEYVPVRTPTSRLSCQVRLTSELDGLIVRLPESQR